MFSIKIWLCIFGNCLLIGLRQKVEKKKMVTYLRKLIKLVLVNSVYMAIIISKESGPALRDADGAVALDLKATIFS